MAKKFKSTFQILYTYIKSLEIVANHTDMANLLDMSTRQIDTWCTQGYPHDAALSAPVINIILFDNDEDLISGFLQFLDINGIPTPNNIYRDGKVSAKAFENFFCSFLLSDISSFSNLVKHQKTTKLFLTNDNKPYFRQTIRLNDTNEELLTLSKHIYNPDTSKINTLKRILLEAPGGQGKSLFIRELQKKTIDLNIYTSVIRVQLTDLLSVPYDEIALFDISKTKTLFAYLSNLKYDISTLRKSVITTESNTKKVLFLFDGLNELLASNDFKKKSEILEELSFVSKNWGNSIIIITTRAIKDKCAFLNAYSVCHLSGTPEDKLAKFLSKNNHLSNAIKSLAKIPMYYFILEKLDNTEGIKTKYDVLFQIYLKRYEQSFKDIDSFFAFFILAPFIARELYDNNKNSITTLRATEICNNIKNMNYNALLEFAQRECDVPSSFVAPDIERAFTLLFHNGPIKYENAHEISPLTNNKGEYRFFHDDIRDFLLVFSALLSMKVLCNCLNEEQFESTKDIFPNLNLKDDAVDLIKEKLCIIQGEDIALTLKEEYSVINTAPITPQTIFYAHTLFSISEYLNLGVSAVQPTHEMLITFTNRIVNLIKQDNFTNCLTISNHPIPEQYQTRCKFAVADIISKHCEHYRRTGLFEEGIKLAEIAETICPNNDAIKNQKGKLLLQLYQTHIKSGSRLDAQIAAFGFENSRALYFEGKRLIESAADNDFNLSTNLLTMLYSVPAPFLFKDKNIKTHFDFVKAFDLCRSLIFTDKQANYTLKEISYAVRQAIGLLLKGYVKFNPDFNVYESGNPGKNSVVAGERNTLKLDVETLKLAKYLLCFIDGMTLPSSNYFRAIIAFHEGDFAESKRLLESETDCLLKTIFLHYSFSEVVDINSLYDDIKTKMQNAELDAIDRCHPIYWYCDAKNLELAFDNNRKTFFDEFEKGLPKVYQNIISQLTTHNITQCIV